jgi:hypothetical protein
MAWLERLRQTLILIKEKCNFSKMSDRVSKNVEAQALKV